MKKNLAIALVSFMLGVFLAGLIFVYFPEKKSPTGISEDPSLPSFSSPLYGSSPSQTEPGTPQNFAEIAEKVGPAVVKITAERVEKRSMQGFGNEWPFEDFWDRFFGTPREQEFRSTAQGTGFFITSDGYILTNNHIVEKAIKVTINSIQGNEYPAKVIGIDPKTDLAMLRVEDKNLPFTELGDSAQLRVGEWVLAIGNPLGFEHTVTAGIVSAKGRQLGGMGVPTYQDFIQTDAAINRGNSGGPLVNMKGEVVGITSMIYSPTGGNIGIGFAIPSNLAKKIINQLKEKGRVVRGYLGVTIYPINEDSMKLLKLKSKKGALVNSVVPGSPADKAGLKTYDVITQVNGQPVEDNNDLMFKIADILPGTKVELTVIRNENEKTYSVKITELEPEIEQETAPSSNRDLGFSVRELSPYLAKRYGFRTQEGLLITRVRQYSEAEKKGLETGDIILEVNKEKMRKVTDLEKILSKLESGDPIMLFVAREKGQEAQEFIVTLRIPE